MAVSDAKRMRLKRIRESKINPELQRRNWGGVNPVQKATPTLSEKRSKLNKKHKKWNLLFNEENGSIFYEWTENNNHWFVMIS